MAGQDEAAVVLAVRVGPGNFLLATDQRVTENLEFEIPPDRFRVVGTPVHLGKDTALATIRFLAGPRAGAELTARLQTGHRQP